MTDETRDPLTAPITDAENQAAYARSLAFNTEAARSGLFAAAVDIADEMQKAGVAQADAAILTAAIEFAAQLWQQMSEKTGIPSSKVRATFLKEAKYFYGKHQRAGRDAPPAVKH